MFTDDQIEELINLLITLDKNTKIYLGCDSVKFVKKGVNYAKYATVCIVHKNGKNGCKMFTHNSVEIDYDVKKNKPSMRLMKEVQKVCELYTQIIPYIDDYDIEIHLDIGTDPKKNASSCVANQAAGYVLGVTNLPMDKIKLKPESWCSSHGADGAVHGRTNQYQYSQN